MDYMVIIWFVVIIVAAIIEINTMDLTSIWFSVGALIAFIMAIVKLNVLGQIIVFLAISIILIISIRPIAKNYLKTNIINTNADRLIGKVAVVTKEAQPGERGEVKIDGKFWLAVNKSETLIEVDDRVEVLAIEGVKLIVEKIQ